MDFKAFTPSVKMVKEGCGPPREEKVRVVHSSSVGVDVHSNLMVVCHEFVVPATGELITETAECSTANKDLRELALKAKAPEIIVEAAHTALELCRLTD